MKSYCRWQSLVSTRSKGRQTHHQPVWRCGLWLSALVGFRWCLCAVSAASMRSDRTHIKICNMVNYACVGWSQRKLWSDSDVRIDRQRLIEPSCSSSFRHFLQASWHPWAKLVYLLKRMIRVVGFETSSTYSETSNGWDAPIVEHWMCGTPFVLIYFGWRGKLTSCRGASIITLVILALIENSSFYGPYLSRTGLMSENLPCLATRTCKISMRISSTRREGCGATVLIAYKQPTIEPVVT